MTTLAPCPFCRETPRILALPQAICGKCGACGPSEDHGGSKWNNFAISAQMNLEQTLENGHLKAKLADAVVAFRNLYNDPDILSPIGLKEFCASALKRLGFE